jgi:hypothetical protein
MVDVNFVQLGLLSPPCPRIGLCPARATRFEKNVVIEYPFPKNSIQIILLLLADILLLVHPTEHLIPEARTFLANYLKTMKRQPLSSQTDTARPPSPVSVAISPPEFSDPDADNSNAPGPGPQTRITMGATSIVPKISPDLSHQFYSASTASSPNNSPRSEMFDQPLKSRKYFGTSNSQPLIIFASHDRTFVQQMATSVLEVREGETDVFEDCGMDDWLVQRKERARKRWKNRVSALSLWRF